MVVPAVRVIKTEEGRLRQTVALVIRVEQERLHLLVVMVLAAF